ncbi:ribosome silencing factor [Piscirickettsia salmonis]|uniref:Ribosomal silencing factor RsfS n=1 Tax=Piscirickettsia salmonis TaxID=1238 RepID=A0A0B8UER5_PISSA|nr:ribosome silencing factor [Piscirickettsia salmonis]RNC78996.1 ribosome silencing factor [Piscirickettsiaceae bacterium NZ-RLO2]AKP72568.1 ribosome silencing factor [Piscirickettsia salmonis LF-89 = ATCC VR-1361]ALA23860.1 Protein Iojap/ribosomal silencing factor RsfS [Piscirickettsia salmonis]ALB23955.1 Protein Iojap/ribosomal silencing factor RsfS [Piscirickettsia salmonis]ALY03777.1 ribosome silencing factor [Piscirickettsia salmonis]
MSGTTEQLTQVINDVLEAGKAKDITVLDVKEMTSITDHMVVASATSSRHLKALANAVVSDVKERGFEVLGVEGEASAEWVLVDMADVILHVMLPDTREFYNLEKFWSMPAA